MLKINKSILIICIISLFLIIGQISASDTDSIEINDFDTMNNSIEDTRELNDYNSNDNQIANTIELNDYNSNDDSIANTIEINDYDSSDNTIDLTENIELREEENDNGMDTKTINSIEIKEQSKNNLNIVMSNDSYSCGAASLATVLNNLGINISLNDAKMAANTTVNGTTMKGLIDAAAKYNLTAYGVYADISNLNENFIVHMNINGAEHWSVIKEINNERVTLADPNLGYVEFDLKNFKEYYTNNSIIILNKSGRDSLDMSNYNIIHNSKLNVISGKGYAYYYSKKISYIKNKVNPGYAFLVKIIVPKWGGNTVKIITKKITSHKICCNVYYKITYYKKAKYKGKSTVINYPCIFNLSMKKGKTVTVNLPTPGIRSFRFYHTVCKFP